MIQWDPVLKCINNTQDINKTYFNTIIYRGRMTYKRLNDSSVNNHWTLTMCLASEEAKEIICSLNIITVHCDLCEERFVLSIAETQGLE